MATKIFIVDDYNIFREGLRLLIGENERFEVVGQSSNPEDLFTQLSALEPDIIVLNLALTKDIVLTICRKLYDKYPSILFVGITEELKDSHIVDCVFKGADGIVWKNSSPDQLIEALNTVISGKRFFNLPEIISAVEIKEDETTRPILEKAFKELSSREEEVFRLFARGMSYKEIGSTLDISPRTVESHKNNILAKLELSSVKDLISFAFKHSLID